MSGYQRSFEYISDYVGISGLGLKIWHSELARIFKFIVEQESNPLVKNKVLPSESSYQSRAVPIPLHSVTSTLGGGVNVPGSSGFAITFIGRLANEIMALTNPRNTVFVHARQAWYDSRTSGTYIDNFYHISFGGKSTFDFQRIMFICTDLRYDLQKRLLQSANCFRC